MPTFLFRTILRISFYAIYSFFGFLLIIGVFRELFPKETFLFFQKVPFLVNISQTSYVSNQKDLDNNKLFVDINLLETECAKQNAYYCYKIARYYENLSNSKTDINSRDFNKGQLNQDAYKSFEFYIKACALDDGKACYKLAHDYSDFLNSKDFNIISKNDSRNLKLSKEILLFNDLTKNNDKESSLIKLYQKSCDNNFADGCFELANFADAKTGTKSTLLYQKSCDLNNMNACQSLANSYLVGGSEFSIKKWFQISKFVFFYSDDVIYSCPLFWRFPFFLIIYLIFMYLLFRTGFLKNEDAKKDQNTNKNENTNENENIIKDDK